VPSECHPRIYGSHHCRQREQFEQFYCANSYANSYADSYANSYANSYAQFYWSYGDQYHKWITRRFVQLESISLAVGIAYANENTVSSVAFVVLDNDGCSMTYRASVPYSESQHSKCSVREDSFLIVAKHLEQSLSGILKLDPASPFLLFV